MESLRDFYSDKRVLITGGHGFKGTWLCLALNHLGSDVIGYGLKNLSSLNFHEALKKNEKNIIFIEDNILNQNKLNKIFNDFKPEIVFHLAADPLVSSGYERPFAMFETNIMGTIKCWVCLIHFVEFNIQNHVKIMCRLKFILRLQKHDKCFSLPVFFV